MQWRSCVRGWCLLLHFFFFFGTETEKCCWKNSCFKIASYLHKNLYWGSLVVPHLKQWRASRHIEANTFPCQIMTKILMLFFSPSRFVQIWPKKPVNPLLFYTPTPHPTPAPTDMFESKWGGNGREIAARCSISEVRVTQISKYLKMKSMSPKCNHICRPPRQLLRADWKRIHFAAIKLSCSGYVLGFFRVMFT